MLKHQTEIRVRYADTDQMQIVYNGKYFEYFEVGRTDLLRNLGLTYKSFEEMGFQLPLIEAGIKFIQPAVYDDLILVEATQKEIPNLKLTIDYKIFRKSDSKLLTEGFTEHVFFNRETKKVIRPPKIYLEKIQSYFTK